MTKAHEACMPCASVDVPGTHVVLVRQPPPLVLQNGREVMFSELKKRQQTNKERRICETNEEAIRAARNKITDTFFELFRQGDGYHASGVPCLMDLKIHDILDVCLESEASYKEFLDICYAAIVERSKPERKFRTRAGQIFYMMFTWNTNVSLISEHEDVSIRKAYHHRNLINGYDYAFWRAYTHWTAIDAERKLDFEGIKKIFAKFNTK
ncbi:MAG: hypothetical protein Q8R36_02425 [bacterium]|nr:hypothetical protein [bacterium]